MTIHHLFPVAGTASVEELDTASTRPVSPDHQAAAEALDRVRVICSDLGVATLLAELEGTDPEFIAEVLDEVSGAALVALATLRQRASRKFA